MNTFSINEAFATGWKFTKERFWFLAGAVLIVMAISNVPSLLESMLNMHRSNAMGLLRFILNLILEMGMIRLSLNLLDGKEASYNDLWSQLDKFLPFLGASILFGLMFGVGLVLLVVPGIIVFLTFCLYSYFIVDKGEGIMESLKMSAAVTKGNRLNLLGFLVLALLLNIVGALLFGVGLFVTVPVTALASASIYRKLTATMSPMVVPETPVPAVTPTV